MSDSNLKYKNKIIPLKTQSRVIFKDIIGHGTAMRKIFRIVEKVANSGTTIMLNGETGTGKGLIARAIHKASGRKDQPFIQINCGATPEGLLESEFFGYRRGAFTGATADKARKFEIAHGGTRRGANMAVLRIDHPDVEEFITCKTNENQITNFNISIGITDDFMHAMQNNEYWDLRFPDVNNEKYRDFLPILASNVMRKTYKSYPTWSVT